MKKRWIGPIGKGCVICKTPWDSQSFFVDGRTKRGPWALMCITCFSIQSIGSATTGNGQVYDIKTMKKVL